MSSNTLISSEQALEEYFSALLDESLEDDEKLEVLEVNDSGQDLLLDMEPAPQSVEENQNYASPTVEIELPNLEDVERLLEQLESTNPVAELHLEEVMEQNTAQISESNTVVEEVQEWPLEEPELAPEIKEVTPEIQPDPIEEEIAQPNVEAKLEQPEVEILEEVVVGPEVQPGGNDEKVWQSTIRDYEFQVLYFDVNGVTFAVPLDELGGIHRIAELNHLIGRPDWYLGLQTGRDAQLDVVDTAKWVMSEKLTDETYKDKYQYIVMLDESMWGLASTQLMGTESINPEKIRWRKTAGKRPWLAGMVKEKMCALIHVEALIAMLNAGLDVKALDK
ncbi:chemotaxis protein CheW [Vibrio zhanjiangensis]|uniref:Chemotaxis protein CheW n=1 Tax=Vibrio zhanjiangensis TaxID=1046128 RepID=A0ABQ6EXK9_9VIBR|nr:chemotaxis protein CheW [Vibrio zhanjiangensis]GLT17416.1 chemotaxis protein CheW [Vibrio zhanjiangensis]